MRKKYSYRNKLIAALLLLTLLSVLILTHVKAEGTAQIWTDKADYAPGDTVTIYGSSFNPEGTVSITVTRPDNSTNEWAVTSDSSGSFNTTYPLDGITGTYTVTATDGTNTATTTFTDDGWPKYYCDKISGDGQSGSVGSTLAPFVVCLSRQGSSGEPKVPQSGLTVTWSITQTPKDATGQSLSALSTTTDSYGKASSTLTLGDKPGTYKVTATGPSGYGSATFSVTAVIRRALQFVETGLPSGTSWSVTVTELGPLTKSSATNTISFGSVDLGSYSYSVSSPISDGTGVQYVASPSSGTADVPAGSGPVTVNIAFTTQYQVSFAVNPSGTGTTTPSATAYYDEGYLLSISATPGTGYVFSSWTTSTTSITITSASSASTTATIGGTGTITANFQLADNIPPTTTISLAGTPGLNGWYKSDVTVTLAATDNPGGSGVKETKYRIGGGSWITYTTQFTITTEGTTTVDYYSTDNAGNEETTKSKTIKIDKTPPTVSLSADRSPDSNGWFNHKVTFTVSATDATSDVDPTKTVTPADYSGPDSSSITVTGSATDKAGNTASASLTFNYDSTAPSTTKTEGGAKGNAPWYVSVVQVELTASDATSGVANTCYRLDMGAWNTYTVPFTVSKEGKTTLDYYSVDIAGNVEAAKSQDIYIDTKAPTTTLTIGDPKWGTDPTYIFLTTPFTLSATDATPGSGVAKTEYSFDGTTSWTTYTGSFTAPSIGSHTLYYRSIDNAGNVEPYKSISIVVADVTVESGFKPGDSPSFASDPYLSDIMCVLVKATGGYKLVGTSPGTYDYAISIRNTGTSSFDFIKIIVNGHSDFILQSSNPIRVLSASGSDITSQFTVSGTWPAITISSKLGSGFQLLPSASMYVTIHLDYAKKGTVFGSQIYGQAYAFKTTVTGACTSNLGKDAWGSVAFLSKKATIIYGFVKTSSGMPIEGATIELYRGSTLLYTETTDADGFYCFIDGCKDDSDNNIALSGGVTYTIACTLPSGYTLVSLIPTSVTAQKDKAVAVNFTKKE